MLATLLTFRPGMERLESREVPSGTATEVETPPTEAETPPAESETPPTETEAPPAESETPSAEAEAPPAEVETPPAEAETPPAEVETPPPPVTTSAPPVVTFTSQLNQNERFVRNLYQDVLGRQADFTGLRHWVTHLDLGTVTQGQVSLSFITSDEYRANTIRSYYQDILGRTPDVSEVNAYVGMFQAGQSQDDIRERFFASDEFSVRYGHNSAAFVSQLYTQILGRMGTTDEVNFWVNRLTSTNGDRAMVVDTFMNSSEYLQIEVGTVYTVFLERLPDEAGFNYWVGQRGNGQAIEMVAAGIMASAEYFLRS